MLKKLLLLLVLPLFLSLQSCKKCVKCHHIKVYEGAKTGTFSILAVKEACGKLECRKYTRQKGKGTDAGGAYNTFWECNLYPEDTTKATK
jgi:hypothetical protein